MNGGRTRVVVGLTAVLLAASGASCGGGGDGDDDPGPTGGERLRVVTTVAPITNIVANIVGEHALVDGVVPEGTNSHTFDPPPSVAETLARADVVFLNGLGLEEPIKRLAGQIADDDATVVELGNRTLPPARYKFDFSFPRSGGQPNPHLWTDPTLVRRYAEIVKDTMSRLDGSHARDYKANYDAFVAAVVELDAAMRASFATIARDRRKLLTYHDAYAYFADSFDWDVIGAIQVSDFDDPTPKEVAELIEQVRREAVPAIFGSEVFPSPVLERIGHEAGVRYVDVLRDDDLPGRPGQPEHSWLGLMRFDFLTMTEALDGDASALRALRVRNVAPDRARYPQ